MIKCILNNALIVCILLFFSSCCPTKFVIYDLKQYKDNGLVYIPIYNPNDPEWVKAEHILKDIAAPANWGTKKDQDQFAGFEYNLYIRTTEQNQQEIARTLPTLWAP